MKLSEIRLEQLNAEVFIAEKTKEIAASVGEGTAVNALSGGVDSSAVTMLAHRALGNRCRTYFVENGIMRDGEPTGLD